MLANRPWDIEDIIDRRSGGYENCKVFDADDRLGVTRVRNHFGIRNKSKSESDIRREFDEKRFKENEDDDSASPSDSDVTIVRFRRKSIAQNNTLTKYNCEGNLGDGSHVANSPSMVNLATTVGRYGESSKIRIRDERLVSLSCSWDGYEAPISTVSDTGIFVTSKNRGSHFSFAAWKRYCLVNKEQRGDPRNDGTIVTTNFTPECIRSDVAMEKRAEPNSNIDNSRFFENDEIEGEESAKNSRHCVVGAKKMSSRLSRRVERAFRCFFGCFRVSKNSKKRFVVVKLK